MRGLEFWRDIAAVIRAFRARTAFHTEDAGDAEESCAARNSSEPDAVFFIKQIRSGLVDSSAR